MEQSERQLYLQGDVVAACQAAEAACFNAEKQRQEQQQHCHCTGRPAKPCCPEVSGLALLVMVPSSSYTSSRPALAMPLLMSPT